MKGRFQWRLDLEIQATPDKVWEVVDDISNDSPVSSRRRHSNSSGWQTGKGSRGQIPVQRAGRKGKGKLRRGGIQYIPHVKLSTRMGEDTWGLDKIFGDFVVESTLVPKDDHNIVEI